jgi:uncharacterized OB-fold protein
VAIERADFPLPDVDDPVTGPFFAAAARGELVIPRCTDCKRYVWYPAAQCPACGGVPAWARVSGRGSLFSWAVVRRPFLPAFADRVPFVTALIALEEDPSVRVASYVVDADDATLRADAPVTVDFRPLAFSTVPGRSVVVPMFTVAPA